MFVHAGGEADGIGKFQAEDFRGQRRSAVELLNQAQGERTVADPCEGMDGLVVGDLGILTEQQRTD